MVGHRSPSETSNDCLVTSFQRGHLLQRVSIQLADIRATQERHLVYTGQNTEAVRQLLEAQRQLMVKLETAPQPPSGPPILKQIKSALDLLGALSKAWPVIRWALALNTFGWLAKHAARLLGWL